MVIRIDKRNEKAPKVQETLTRFGCSIKTRLGLHEAGDFCSEEGLLILQLTGDPDGMKKLETALNEMDGVTARTIRV